MWIEIPVFLIIHQAFPKHPECSLKLFSLVLLPTETPNCCGWVMQEIGEILFIWGPLISLGLEEKVN